MPERVEKVPVMIRLPKDLVVEVDGVRGDTSRTLFIERLLRGAVGSGASRRVEQVREAALGGTEPVSRTGMDRLSPEEYAARRRAR